MAMLMVLGCSERIDIVNNIDYTPAIYPDYRDVTIPVNIAPLNFCVTDTTADVAIISAGGDTIYVEADGNAFDIPEKRWHKMVAANAGKDITIEICRKAKKGYEAYRPFSIHISEDSIDNVIAYRLIPPGYAMWNRMGIYQRNLETFEERNIYDNRHGKGNCVNCHSFCQGDPKNMLFHLRKRHAGTYIFTDGKAKRIGADMSQQLSNPVYPYWHPSGKYVAFSTNKTFQMFHSSDPNIIEVGDDASDIIVYDIEKDRVFTTELLKSDDAFETFPCFSPDGKYLYYSTAKAVNNVERNYKAVKYSICRIAFDEKKQRFGDEVDTIYNAREEGRSAVLPRISPDGKRLAFTVSDYGNFTIWHQDADIYMANLESGETCRVDIINSDRVESYHSWSRNSRWLAFSSRRDDGIYTRPYFAHIDNNGEASKPFMLPQKNPANYYKMQKFSYNIPELIEGWVETDSHTTAEKLSAIW